MKYAKPFRFKSKTEKDADHKRYVKRNGWSYQNTDYSKKAKLAIGLGDLMLIREALKNLSEKRGFGWQKSNSISYLRDDVQRVITGLQKR